MKEENIYTNQVSRILFQETLCLLFSIPLNTDFLYAFLQPCTLIFHVFVCQLLKIKVYIFLSLSLSLSLSGKGLYFNDDDMEYILN
jgi:hypothetical protein